MKKWKDAKIETIDAFLQWLAVNPGVSWQHMVQKLKEIQKPLTDADLDLCFHDLINGELIDQKDIWVITETGRKRLHGKNCQVVSGKGRCENDV